MGANFLGNRMTKFILASQSPRRAELLRQLGLEFETLPSNSDEDSIPKTSPVSYVKKAAKLKARTVAKQVKEGVIIGIDTEICIGDRIIGKPKDNADAFSTLKELSGKIHYAITGICVIDKYSGKIAVKSVKTNVKFGELSDDVIRWYIETGEPMGHTGSYAIQGKGAIFVEWIKGDYYNINGLPLFTLAKMLEEMNLLVHDK
jgi:septum formation protein